MMAPTKVDDVSDALDDNASQSLAQSRSRRQRVDKKGRLAAFEQLRKAKEQGVKHKFDLEEKNVYDVVEESEYSDMVRQRQEDDWIVDDDGAGYVEDGREIFDDDMDEESVAQSEGKGKDGGKKNKNIVRPGAKPPKPKKDIKSMFAAAAASSKRKPEKDVSVAGDDMLGDLMAELTQGGDSKHSSPSLVGTGKKASTSTPKAVAKKVVNPFSVKPGSQKPVQRDTPTRLVSAVKVEPSRKSSGLSVAHGKKTQAANKVVVKREPVEPEDMDYDIEPVESQAGNHSQKPDGQENGVGMELNDIDFDDDEMGVKQEVSVEEADATDAKSVVKSEPSFAGWETVQCERSDQTESGADVQVDSSMLPVVTDADGKQVLRFYWLDAFEDPYKQPGTVYLFGKVWIDSAKTHVSCCVTVRNIQRCVYLLPRPTRVFMKTKDDTGEPVRMQDVYQEFNERITEKHKIMTFKSRPVSKKYAFEKTDVPVESDYLEVRYSADLPALPSDLQGETFSHVFGTNTSSLEHLLMDRKMKGPCWLDLYNIQPSNPPVSWCKVEAVVQRPDHVTVHSGHLAPPPLVVMTLNLRMLPNPKTHQNEVIGAAALIHDNFHMDRPAPNPIYKQYFSVISTPNDCIFPYDFRDKVQQESKKMKVEVLPTERALLGYLLAKVHKVDPDLIVGHDIYGFDLDVLLHRISANKIPHWSKIGRLKRTVMPKLSGGFGRATFAEKSAVCGRLLSDVKISAREVIRCRSYDLTELVSHILHSKRVQLDYDEIRDMYSTSPQLLRLVELMLMDSTYILRILYELNVIPLALQITNICGNIMGRTLMGGRSERNEYLLLHAFREKGFICPDKEYKQKNKHVEAEDEGEENQDTTKKKGQQGRRKPAYAGGLVLEPKKGYYDKYILLLDFNSLYPSIIQEYNICFTTVPRAEQQKSQDEEEEDLTQMLPSSDLEPGILPTEIRKLVESRQQVKQLMKTANVSPEQLMQYDIRQKALKLTANSMYGCLGFTFSRFYAKPLAALVTGKGREILMKTKQLVEGMGLEVIYGDTDSIMVNSNSTDMEQVFKLGNKVKAEVNKLYRLLEIDIDGVFKSMLLLKKKKYAALNVTRNPDGSYTTTQELKGLDIVRRDWCDLAKEAGNYVVRQILSGESRETVVENIHSKLTEVGQQVRSGELSLELFQINKQLTKNPEDYPDKKNQSHVQVAMRINSKGGKKMRAGDTVAYVICIDGSNLSATQRAYHPDELAKNEMLKLDVHYYLAHQIHPVVSRLCDPIEGTDAAHIAECLGLDPAGYRHTQHHHGGVDEEDALLAAQMTEEEKYRDCERFKFVCPAENCGRENIVDGVFTSVAPESTEKGGSSQAQTGYVLAQCQRGKCSMRPYEHVAYLQNRLTLAVRSHISKYYLGWLKCEDSACGTRTRRLPLTFQRGHPICAACKRGMLHQEYSDSMLYTQLSFYQYIFDVDKARTLITAAERLSVDSQASKEGKGLTAAYRTLKSAADGWQRENGYSQVNLSKVFQGLFLFKREKQEK